MENEQFTVTVDGLGAFTFLRRTMRQEMRIGAEYSRLTEGVSTPTEWFELVAGMLSALKVLTVSAPADWVLDDLDPTDDETYASLIRVHRALREQEDDFRRAKKERSTAGGARAIDNLGVLVSSTV